MNRILVREPEDTPAAQQELAAPIGREATMGELWGMLLRSRWIIIGCLVICAAGAFWLTSRATPVYRSSISIRINERQSVIPEVLRTLSGAGSDVSTEREVLSSRTLIEDAVRELGLQLRVVEPRIARSNLLSDIEVAPHAVPGTYMLRRGPGGTYTIIRESSSAVIAKVRPDERVRFEGLTFRVRPRVAEYERIRLDLATFQRAVESAKHHVHVTRLGRDADILTLSYEGPDPEVTWRVPNLIAERFVARREAGQRTAVGSSIAFLRQQLDTIAVQLRSAESALLAYRERERVVNPAVEGSTQLSRIVQLQSERSTLETERAALAKLMSSVERAAATQRPDEPSPYRNLISFPTLLRNQTTSQLLNVLVSVDGQRTELLARRTPNDPDVKTLTTRMKGIESELHGMASTYLQGLTHQVKGIDSTLSSFGQELRQVPQRELQYARLVRQPKLLEELYSLLQTRLKEAEIAQAASDLSVEVVDPAILPRVPISPRPMLNLVLGLMVGGLIGTGLGFFREFLDKTVHTRADVWTSTGLSVIGLIPRIPRGRSRFALISQKGGSSNQARTPPPSMGRRLATRRLAIAAASEAYGSLLTNLSYSLKERPPRVVVFTSGQPGEGKTTNAVNFALTLSGRGSRVVLIDCDLRRGLVHSMFEVPREPGLTNVLKGEAGLEDALHRIAFGERAAMDYLTTGTLPSNPASLVESSNMQNLLDRLKEEYDGVIIDTPPVNVITDAALLARYSDGVVIVARAGVTHAPALGYAVDQLRQVHAPVVGVILSDIDFARDAAYDPAYRYYRYEQYTASER